MPQEKPGGWKIGYTVYEAKIAAEKGEKPGAKGGLSDKTNGRVNQIGKKVFGVILSNKK